MEFHLKLKAGQCFSLISTVLTLMQRFFAEAKGFVNASTSIAEVGTVRILDSAGQCVNCSLAKTRSFWANGITC